MFSWPSLNFTIYISSPTALRLAVITWLHLGCPLTNQQFSRGESL